MMWDLCKVRPIGTKRMMPAAETTSPKEIRRKVAMSVPAVCYRTGKRTTKCNHVTMRIQECT